MKESKLKITDFFKNEYVDQASYDNLRKIASVVDGQKNASRKVLYTILEHNIKSDIKVSQLGAKCSEFAEYLHGSIDGVVVGLAQNFPGSNNIPLLVREGNFGTRFDNEASAARYIFTHGSKEFFELFNKEDSAVLKDQFFEGAKIEPMHYVPNLPLLLINGSQGVSSGFAQLILPRKPENIKKYLKDSLAGKKLNQSLLDPYFNGFNGTIAQGDNPKQWIISGTIERKSASRLLITEVPVGYGLMDYIKILDKLEDDKVILGYSDMSEDNKFLFEVRMTSSDLKKFTDDDLLQKLKLQKKVSENYTVMSESNRVLPLETSEEIISRYIQVKLEYTQKRKDNQLKNLASDIDLDKSRYLFIKGITEDTIKISKRKKAEIEESLKKIPGIIERDGSYDYLLNMAIHSLTEERMKRLENNIAELEKSLKALEKTEVKDIWLAEI